MNRPIREDRTVNEAKHATCYPELAAKLEGFDPFHPTPQDLEKLKETEATGAS
jgi:hypothetical protein